MLDGLLNSFDDHDELYWEATGARWLGTLQEVSVTVHAPDGVRQVACYAGEPDSRAGCDQAAALDRRRAQFRHLGVASGSGVTVVVGLDKGVVAVAPPVLAEPYRGTWEEPPSPAAWLAAVILVIATAATGWLVWLRRGRDKVYAGLPLGLAPAPGQRAAQRSASVGGPEPAVAFTPPAGMRPALAGVLLTERTAPVQISATVVDLAIRGYLRIKKLRGRDWKLVWLGQQRPDDGLWPYEAALLDELFRGKPVVRLSSLNGRFRDQYRRVCLQLACDAYRTGWFRHRPRVGGRPSLDEALRGLPPRARFVIYPLMPVLAAFLLVWLATEFGLDSDAWSAVVITSGVLAVIPITYHVWRAMPARTAMGHAVWAQLVGFRRYLETAEADQLRNQEAASIFSRYIPLAMIFGLTHRWATVFAQLATEQNSTTDVSWYYGDTSDFGQSVTDFGETTSTIFTAPPSASAASGDSGFSSGTVSGSYSDASIGAGASGGGGGSW